MPGGVWLAAVGEKAGGCRHGGETSLPKPSESLTTERHEATREMRSLSEGHTPLFQAWAC